MSQEGCVLKQKEPQHLNLRNRASETIEGKPNQSHRLSTGVHMCGSKFASKSLVNNSNASHTLLCQTDGSTGMLPLSLKTYTAVREQLKE